jgi:hypothetical protein
MKFIVIFKLKLLSGGSGFQPRLCDSPNRVYLPLPGSHNIFKLFSGSKEVFSLIKLTASAASGWDDT